jgi:hypothetical protein
MRNGWELHKVYDSFKLIKVGTGVKEISYENYHCLKYDRVIESNYRGGPPTVFTLTELGKTIEL